MLFRKGFLTVVIATGTLSMGINMPCKTVVFTGDSVYLSALNFRQASGRAGRRGFDVLGNVVFHNMAPHRVLEIMSAKLPDLRGQFSTSVTLILRLFILLNGTDNSEFAAGAVKALLTQSWLYLGGPDAKMSIVHHLRFSIDYLRRQDLLSATGVPLNFSGLISHLHYTESAAFGFHALLRGGYLHQVCAAYSRDMDDARWRGIALPLVLTLSHLFVREPCSNPKAALPPLPPDVHAILVRHNAEIVDIYRDYVRSYATQHLANIPDNTLPLTRHTIAPHHDEVIVPPLSHLPPVIVRSPFSALSGLTDSHFTSAHDLCSTVRAGVSLEASIVPSVPLDSESPSRKSNSYLVDFFKHGDKTALERENGIRAADVWFRLKDFSLVLASIVASLEGFLRPGSGEDLLDQDGAEEGDYGYDYDDEVNEAAIKDWGGEEEDKEKVSLADDGEGGGGGEERKEEKRKKKKAVVADSWEDEEGTTSSESDSKKVEAGPRRQWGIGCQEATSDDEDDEDMVFGFERGQQQDHQSLVKVYEALKRVKAEFDEKFLKIWA
jgi:ATP-dependent RNA helicase DDX60